MTGPARRVIGERRTGPDPGAVAVSAPEAAAPMRCAGLVRPFEEAVAPQRRAASAAPQPALAGRVKRSMKDRARSTAPATAERAAGAVPV